MEKTITRVFVTGIGAVTPIGIGKAGLWEGMQSSRSGIRRITRFDASGLRSQVAGEVHGFCPEDWIPKDQLKSIERCARFSVAASRMALEDAGLSPGSLDRARVGCFLGTALAGVGHYELEYCRYRVDGLGALNRALAFSIGGVSGLDHISRELGVGGPMSTSADSCSAGPIAIGRALNAIRRGDIDVALAGGSEAPLAPLCFSAFDVIRAMSSRFNDNPGAASRPFDRDRDGFVMGEGAAMLLLESEEHARNRGAVCLAEIAGYALTNDAHHMTAPRTDGVHAARAIRGALRDAGCEAEEIDVVSAHGSSTPLNDPTETAALKMALGDQAWRTFIVATKSRHGHPLGATGAIEAAMMVLGLHHNWMPGALNLDNPSPECDLNYGQNGPCKGPFRAVLSNSFGFGGINACLVLKPVDVV